jgi:hypothetical protein
MLTWRWASPGWRPSVGRWLDRHGPRLLMTVGSALAALLVAAWRSY